MTDLLAQAVEAHGGLDRWSTVKTIFVTEEIAPVDADGEKWRRLKVRVYAYEGDYQIVREPVLVAIDMTAVTVTS